MSKAIAVMRPRLPDAQMLLPYLRRIDETRVYSNQGPLSMEFERRIEAMLDLPEHGFVSAGNGTAALVAAILATAGRASADRPLALIPAYTFVATASAVQQCGYTPLLADIDPVSWGLDPRRLLGAPFIERLGVVVPVAPFGRPQRQRDWQEFLDTTSVPVVFDGAASFDVCSGADVLGALPVAMSFHATKSFATGEGGGIATTDVDLAMRVRRALNFGFLMSRSSCSASINGKMSEYHAAVGLAELDGWEQKRAALREVAARYRHHAAQAGIADRIVTSPDISATYVLFVAADAAAATAVERALADEAIGSRHWYGLGIQKEPYFLDLPREELPVTERLAPSILGLPVAPDLPDDAIGRVIRSVASRCN